MNRAPLWGHADGCGCRQCLEFASYQQERERQQRLTRESLSGRPEYPAVSAEELEEVRKKLEESLRRPRIVIQGERLHPDLAHRLVPANPAETAARRDQAALQRARENSLPPKTAEQKARNRELAIARGVPDDCSPFWTGADGSAPAFLSTRLGVDRDALRSWRDRREDYALSGNKLDLDLMLGNVTPETPPLASDVAGLLDGERIAREAPGEDRRIRNLAIGMVIAVVILLILHFALGGTG